MLLSSLAVCIQEVWFQKRKLKLKEMPTLLRPRVQPAASLQPACSQQPSSCGARLLKGWNVVSEVGLRGCLGSDWDMGPGWGQEAGGPCYTWFS